MASVKKKNHTPSIIRENGLRDLWKAGRVAVVTEPDEDNPKRTVTRIRVKSSYDEMLNRGTITKEQRDCAERYVILYEKAGGATQEYATVNLLSESRNRWEPKYSQLEAIETIRNIKGEVGKYHICLLDKIIIQGLNGKQIIKEFRMNELYARGQIVSAFILLEEAFKELDNAVRR